MAEIDDAVAEASAWLRSLNRNRQGEDVAARLEAAVLPVAPGALDALEAQFPAYAETWQKVRADVAAREPEPEPEPVEPEA